MIHDTCDYCFREYGREPGKPAICPSCGLENVRPRPPETTMLNPAVEQAVLPRPQPRPPNKRGKPRR